MEFICTVNFGYLAYLTVKCTSFIKRIHMYFLPVLLYDILSGNVISKHGEHNSSIRKFDLVGSSTKWLLDLREHVLFQSRMVYPTEYKLDIVQNPFYLNTKPIRHWVADTKNDAFMQKNIDLSKLPTLVILLSADHIFSTLSNPIKHKCRGFITPCNSKKHKNITTIHVTELVVV